MGFLDMLVVYFLIAIAAVVLDQLSKWATVENIGLGETVSAHNPLFSFTYLRNNGAAWSILEGKMWFFYLITFVAVVVVSYLLVKNYRKSVWLSVGLAFILGGAVGNFIDRIRLGYVVDMVQLDFINFPIFNVADSFLTVGVICVFIYIILDERKLKGESNE